MKLFQTAWKICSLLLIGCIYHLYFVNAIVQLAECSKRGAGSANAALCLKARLNDARA